MRTRATGRASALFFWDEALRDDELQQLKAAIPSWMNGSSVAYLCGLLHRLGPDDTLRLFELLSESGGLTPTEARPWLEPPEREWIAIEAILYGVLDQGAERGNELPYHLSRWLEQRRGCYGPRSLFE